MLSITKTIEYSLIALRHINENGNKICTAKEISESYHIPKEIMAKTMQKLCKRNYVSAIQGPNGGYYLNRKMNSIKLIDFIEDIEGPIGIVECSIDNTCSLLEFCNIKSPISKINQNNFNKLSGIYLWGSFSKDHILSSEESSEDYPKLTLEEIEKLTKSFGGTLLNVNLTGGEPFARKDIIDIAKLYILNSSWIS